MIDKNRLRSMGIQMLNKISDAHGMQLIASRQQTANHLALFQNDGGSRFLLCTYAYKNEPHISNNPLLTATDLKLLGLIDQETYKVMIRAELNDTDLSMKE